MDNFEELKKALERLKKITNNIAEEAAEEIEGNSKKEEIIKKVNEAYDKNHNEEACEKCKKQLKMLVDEICKNEKDISGFALITTNSTSIGASRMDLLNLVIDFLQNIINENIFNEAIIRKLVEIVFTNDKEKINRLREETLKELMKMANEN